MGLKSLPLLNKSGISMYWNNIWDSIKLYKKYSLSFFFLNDVIFYFLSENLYYHCILKMRFSRSENIGLRKYKHIDISMLKSSWKLKYLYLGKILFLNYQNWTIVIIGYYMVKRKEIFKLSDDLYFLRRSYRALRFNCLGDISELDDYKYKF